MLLSSRIALVRQSQGAACEVGLPGLQLWRLKPQMQARFALICAPQSFVLPTLVPEQVTQDAKADLPPPDALQEGGDTPGQRRCTFMNLALALLPGLDDRALGVLCSAALPALQVSWVCCFALHAFPLGYQWG